MRTIESVDEHPPVTRASLREMLPIVAPMSMTLLPTRVWTQEQWDRIKRGYRARGMDEKWDVYVEGHVAFLHRSWTGRGVFEASVRRRMRVVRFSARLPTAQVDRLPVHQAATVLVHAVIRDLVRQLASQPPL